MPATIDIPGRDDVRLIVTNRHDGDFSPVHVPHPLLESRRRLVADLPWTQLREDHGIVVVAVESPGEHDGAEGDALVTDVPDAVLGVWTGDCAPVCLVGDSNVAAVHAGWRGLRDGVLEAACRSFDERGDTVRRAVIGPRIGRCCNEFGEQDLDVMVRRFGEGVRSRDRRGMPALDVSQCVTAAIALATGRDVEVHDLDICTGCDDRFFSHRTRRESGRQVMAVWIDPMVGRPGGAS